MATLADRLLTPDEAHAVAAWRYPAPYERYDVGEGAVDVLLHRDRQGHGYYPLVEGDELVVWSWHANGGERTRRRR